MAKQNEKSVKIGFWHAVRDIVITGMNKGQLLPLTFAAVVIIILLKLPSGSHHTIALAIVDGFKDWDLVGWVLWILTSFVWALLSKKARTIHGVEMNRIAEEKSIMQGKVLGNQIKSSKK